MSSWSEIVKKLQALIVAFEEDLADTCHESLSYHPTALPSEQASIEPTATVSAEQLDCDDDAGTCEMVESRSDQLKSPSRPPVPAGQDRTTSALKTTLFQLQQPLKSKPARQLWKKYKCVNNKFIVCKEHGKDDESDTGTELVGKETCSDALQPKKCRSDHQFRKKYKYVNKKFIVCKETGKEGESGTELVGKETCNMNDPFEFVGTQLTPAVDEAEVDDGGTDCGVQFELFEDTSVDKSTEIQQNQMSSDVAHYQETVADIVVALSDSNRDKTSAKELTANNAVVDVKKLKSKGGEVDDDCTAIRQQKCRREQQRRAKENQLKQVAEDNDDDSTMQLELFEEMSVDEQQPSTTGERRTAAPQKYRREQQQRLKEKGTKQENGLKQLAEDIADAEMYDLIISQRCLTKPRTTDTVPEMSHALDAAATELIDASPRDTIAYDAAAGCADAVTNYNRTKSTNGQQTTDAVYCQTLSDSDECDDTQVYDPLLSLGDRQTTDTMMPHAALCDTATQLTTSSSHDNIANDAAASGYELWKKYKCINGKFIACEETGQEDESDTELVGNETHNVSVFESGCQLPEKYKDVNKEFIVCQEAENDERDVEIVGNVVTAAVEVSNDCMSQAAVTCIASETAVTNTDDVQQRTSTSKDLTVVYDDIATRDIEAHEEGDFDSSLQQRIATKNVVPVSEVAVCDTSLQSDGNITQQVVDVSPSETLCHDVYDGHTMTVTVHSEPTMYVGSCEGTDVKRSSLKKRRKTQLKRCRKINMSCYDGSSGLKRMRSKATKLIASDVEDYSSG